MNRKKRAYVSVYNKERIVEFCRYLVEYGYEIIAEIERLVPALKQGGGYIFSSDHSIPNSVSAENFRAILDTVKRVGRY